MKIRTFVVITSLLVVGLLPLKGYTQQITVGCSDMTHLTQYWRHHCIFNLTGWPQDVTDVEKIKLNGIMQGTWYKNNLLQGVMVPAYPTDEDDTTTILVGGRYLQYASTEVIGSASKTILTTPPTTITWNTFFLGAPGSVFHTGSWHTDPVIWPAPVDDVHTTE